MLLQSTFVLFFGVFYTVCFADDYRQHNKVGDNQGYYQTAQQGDSYHKEESYSSKDGKKSGTIKGGRYYYGGKYTGKLVQRNIIFITWSKTCFFFFFFGCLHSLLNVTVNSVQLSKPSLIR